MNKVVTSKDEILHRSQELIRERGLSAISIRSVAAACGVSVGSVYNYFDSKAELVSAAVESVWREIFNRPEDGEAYGRVRSMIEYAPGIIMLGTDHGLVNFNTKNRSFEHVDNGTTNRNGRWKAADAPGMAAYSGRALLSYEAGH